MQASFSLVEHPSDLGIEARGATPAEAFEQAACGLIAVILDPATVVKNEMRSIEVEAADIGQLLVRWLSELLYLYDAKHFIAGSIRIEQLGDRSLRASVWGEQYRPPRAGTRCDVKAVTYHQLSLRSDTDGTVLRVFLDI